MVTRIVGALYLGGEHWDIIVDGIPFRFWTCGSSLEGHVLIFRLFD